MNHKLPVRDPVDADLSKYLSEQEIAPATATYAQEVAYDLRRDLDEFQDMLERDDNREVVELLQQLTFADTRERVAELAGKLQAKVLSIADGYIASVVGAYERRRDGD